MKQLIILLLPLVLSGLSPFDTPKEKTFNLSVFNTKVSTENNKAMKNEHVICREVCDKKLYKEQKIAAAISFYKRKTKSP